MASIIKRLDELEQALDPKKLAEEAYQYFRNTTPIRSGNARRNTHLRGDEIRADYAYATRLDNGWSRQAPNGMSEPTTKFIQEYIKKQGN
jgi:hypothetical protein